MFQREQITKYLNMLSLSDETLVIHSDCDEIPRAAILEQLSGANTNVLLGLTNFANYINLQDWIWWRGQVISWKNFKGIQRMRQDIFLDNTLQHRRHSFSIMRIPDFWTTRRFNLWKLPELVREPEL